MKKVGGQFSWLREALWPIYGRENAKFIFMLSMMCSSIFCYTILRILKDTYILSAPLATANSISFVKFGFVTPISVIYMYFFCCLTNRFTREKVFFFSVLPLIIFFVLFYLVFIPNIEFFHMSVERVKYYQDLFPRLRNFIPVIGYWGFTLFYVAAELVGTVVITFLFWDFANYCVTPDEATRFYPLFATYSYACFAIAGFVMPGVFNRADKFPRGSKEYSDALFVNFYLIIGSLLFFLLLYFLINRYIVVDSNSNNNMVSTKKLKPKISFSESMMTIWRSKYLMSIVLVIVCYGVSTNLMELTWKEVFRRELDGGQVEMAKYLSTFYSVTAVFTVLIGFLNKFLLKRFGWLVPTAMVPLFLMFSSFIFFFLIVFGVYIPSKFLFGYSATCLAMQLGFLQDNFAKGGRYGVLDPNLQMVYMPLDDELKSKGKASVDIIGSRVGKSLGSFIEFSSSMLFRGADQVALAPIFMPIVVVSCGVWWLSVVYLSKGYFDLLKSSSSKPKGL